MEVNNNQMAELCVWSILEFFSSLAVICLKSPILQMVKHLDMKSPPCHISLLTHVEEKIRNC